ncbi:Dbl homology domain-containing protein [Rhizoclosmatium globosum]|uniref:Dbl homology domain-containing protein n=1 Tax=Rhizoclosmatium globosum TaxID=329046 RepID=A0A1Y2CTQ0_9FUNG|nr:Dbl homology domain-containing protein [Rhizoclosmatium globosum]|eukprot:ORY50337.1 Dbl homology domain-containing protein [Rhizoclosmatium globosum]
MHEIISTENAYVADLDVLMTVFLGKIRAGNVLRGKDLSVVFGNLEGILAVNKELLRRLEERKAQHPNGVIEQIGDIFVKVTDYLKMYTMYCSNHPYALMKLQTVRQTKSIAKFLDALTLLPNAETATSRTSYSNQSKESANTLSSFANS